MSLKRGAEKQLTKDGADEDVEEVDGAGGFKKADESVLASRPMRGLPKRSAPLTGSAVGAVGASGTPDTTPKFGSGFKGFGTSSSSAFTFSTPANTSTSIAGTTSVMPPSSSSDSPFKFSTPNVAASASSATKQFASFLGPSLSATTQPNGTTSTPTSTLSSSDPQVKYFIALRGLNLALKAEIEKAIQNDPFVDLTNALDNYQRYREEIEKEHNPSKKPQTTTGLNGAPTTLFGSAPSASAPKPPTMPSLPTPPSSFSFGGSTIKPAATTSSPSTTQDGFKSSINGTGSGVAPGFQFSTPPSSTEKATSNPFSLPSSSTSTSLFGSNATKPPLFGGSSGTSSSPFGSTAVSSTSKPPTSVFGSSSVFGANTETSAASSGSSTPSGAFGNFASTSTPSSSGGFAFGAGMKPSSSSVGFSFGNSPTPEPEGSSSASKGTGEGVTPKASTPLAVEDSRGATPASTEGGDIEEHPKQLGTNPNDEEGEGEEDEETLHTSRVKIYKFGTKDEKPSWVEVGVGMLRLKKHKTNGTKRMLSRNSATGKLMVNFRVYSGLNCTRTKQSLSFIGHEGGNRVTYRVRLKDESDAIALKEAIDKEVASL